MAELPKIISVDDHVVEPAHVWQTWLPEKHRASGPRVERARFAPFVKLPGARYVNEFADDGDWGDSWVYEDRLIYVQKKFVAIPREAISGEPPVFDRSKMQMVASTYDDMIPGCYDRDARVADFLANWTDGSLPFPTFPRFCGQTFMEGNDKELGLACVVAYNDWMIQEWCAPSQGVNIPLCILPLWDVDLCVAEVARIADQGVHAICFSEIPSKLGLPSIHTGDWDPLFAICDERAVTLNMHIGSSSSMPAASPDSPEAVGSTLQFNNAFASMIDWLFSGKLIEFPNLKLAYSEGQIGWMPYALERADRVWELHEPWTHAKAMIPDLPSTYFAGRIYGCFTDDVHGLASLGSIGTRNVCFEVDYPHSDTTWPDTKAHVEKMVAHLDDDTVYRILRGNAIEMLSLDRV
ncbi:MAG: amidohydrolase family protein [Actinomycetes bacterium]